MKNNRKKKEKRGKGNMAEPKEKIEEELTATENLEPEVGENAVEEADSEPVDKTIELEAKIAELEATIAKMKDDDLRQAADTENYKKRLRADKESAIRYANEQLISDLLSPIDNFSRALEAANATSDFEAMKQGVAMVQDQLLSLLKSKWGLSPIDTVGKDFDPNTMEAYSMQEKDDLEKETVLQEFASGWLLNGKVIRTAKVLVGKPKKN